MSDKEVRNMDNKVLQLFKENHVPQVRDKLLEVTQDLAKNDVLLNKNLKLHYSDILTITEGVNKLYLGLQDNDTHFRQLCFDDDKYQLGRLPDFEENSFKTDKIDSKSVISVGGSSVNADDVDSDTELLLVVSQWSLAVSKFVSAVNGSTTVSTSIIDKLFTNFNQLVDYKDDISFTDTNFKYYQSVIDKLLFLQSNLIENANIIMLSHLQWIKIYNLINDTTKTILPWDNKLISELNEITMDKVIKLVLSIANVENNKNKIEFNSNDIIKDFINSTQFNDRILAHIKDKTRHNLNELKLILSNDNVDMESNKEITITHMEVDDLTVLIEESKFDSLGLINKRRQQVYDLVEPTIQMIQQLIEYNCDSTAVKEIQTEMVDFLNNQCLDSLHSNHIDSNEGDQTTADTSSLIAGFVASYHKDNFTHLIQSQIQRLQALST